MSKQTFKQWLNGVESYYVSDSDLRDAEDEHNVKVTTGPITVHMNDDGETMIPHRDIRHAEWNEADQ